MAMNRSLAHGLNILLLYDTSKLSFAVSEMSKQLGYSQSKTYRLVKTLNEYGFLQEDGKSAKYHLGLNTLRLGLLYQERFDVSGIARPFMKELSRITKETVLLTAVNGTKGIVLERVESEEPIRYSMFQSGAIIPLHAGASSKILMAFIPDEEWDRIIKKEGLKRYTPNTITNVNQLKTHLREIRKKGYAFSDQEVDRDVRAVAAPIFNGLGELVGGLSVTGPAYRISKKRIVSCGKLVSQYAKKISSQLGRQPERSMLSILQ
jgi:IclR family KDG regulon transcriptional repressor